MTINYIHNLPQDPYSLYLPGTIAYIPFTGDDFLHYSHNSFRHSGEVRFEISIGYSLLHPLDQYKKSVGREIAVKNVKPVTFTLLKANSDANQIDYTFIGKHPGQVEIQLVIRVYRDSLNARIIKAIVSKR